MAIQHGLLGRLVHEPIHRWTDHSFPVPTSHLPRYLGLPNKEGKNGQAIGSTDVHWIFTECDVKVA